MVSELNSDEMDGEIFGEQAEREKREKSKPCQGDKACDV